MTLIIIFVMLCVVLGGAVAVPPIYKKLIELKKEEDKNKFLLQMENKGSPEQRQRVKQLKMREENLKLKMLECEQAAEVLDSDDVRDKLKDSNIDVEELKKLLSDNSNDEVLKEYKALEQYLTKEKK
jgi:TolA-binding protein